MLSPAKETQGISWHLQDFSGCCGSSATAGSPASQRAGLITSTTLHRRPLSPWQPQRHKQLWPAASYLAHATRQPSSFCDFKETLPWSRELKRNGKFQVSEQHTLQVSFLHQPCLRRLPGPSVPPPVNISLWEDFREQRTQQWP